MDTCEIYLAESKESSYFGGRWVVMLSSPDNGLYDVYYSVSSPYTENGYEREEFLDLRIEHRHNLLTQAVLLGCFQMDWLGRFTKVFKRTIPGPDQFFAVRLIHGLSEEGLIEQLMVNRILQTPTYSNADKAYYDNNLSPVDCAFYAKEVRESGHLCPEEMGRNFHISTQNVQSSHESPQTQSDGNCELQTTVHDDASM